MDPRVLKKTQDTLGKVIKKPPLTEKLLNKPPFRFLHDIITEVIKNTGVLKGLYTDGELISANVNEKEAKITFLQKAIDCIGMINGNPLSVRPSKIVAGHEPEKTNEFLYYLGKLCLEKADTSEAVKKVLSGDKPITKKKSRSKEKDETKEKEKEKEGTDRREEKVREKEKDRDKEPDKEKGREKDRERKKEKERGRKEGENEPKEKKRDGSAGQSKDEKPREDRKERKEREGSSKDRVESSKEKKGSSKDRENSKSKERDSKDREGSSKEKDRHREKERRSRSKDKGSKDEQEQVNRRDRDKERSDRKERERKEKHGTTEKIVLDEDEDQNNNEEDGPDNGRGVQRPASAKGQRSRPNEDGSDDETIQHMKETEKEKEPTKTTEPRKASGVRRPARPSSARPAPPRKKKQENAEELQNRVDSGRGKPQAPVIIDGKKGQEDEDEDDTFIVEEDPALQNILEIKQSESNSDLINTEEHGSLVRKMLESKKEADSKQKVNKTSEDKPVLFDAARKKEREMAEKEINKLRESIQHLVRSAHPLGKIMDYVQEDIDSMQKELNVWREENIQHEKALKAEQSITESEVEPLQAQLANLELEIAEMMDKISTVKSNILRNEEKMEELVSGVST